MAEPAVNIFIEGAETHTLHQHYISRGSLVLGEWFEAFMGDKPSRSNILKRRIETVPPLLRKVEHNKEEYDPLVVSLGPYHHGNPEFLLAENFKQVAVQLFISDNGKSVGEFYSKILEVIDGVRNCYVEGSTDAYSDEEFAKMMLLDGCFVLNYIECVSRQSFTVTHIYEHLGALGLEKILRDMFLLENQLPYQVLQVLMSLRFDDDGEEIINAFFNILNSGVLFQSWPKVTPDRNEKQPLHLLEIYRMSSFSKVKSSNSVDQSHNIPKFQWRRQKNKLHCDSFKLENHIFSFCSVTELKAKGIRFTRSNSYSISSIKFKSFALYGQLELPLRIIAPTTKGLFLNLIAYEMCPYTPNDLRVTSYIRFLKSLIDHPDDVKELRSRHILLNNLGNDEQVVKMFQEISIPVIAFFASSLEEVKDRIEKHYNSKAKTWIAELVLRHFRSPWTTIALLAATLILILAFLQSYFTIAPRHSN